MVASPNKLDATESKTRVLRDAKGHFLPGSRANPNGRPTKRSLVEALRDLTDPDEQARELIKRSKKSDTVLMYLFDRLEGRPKQSTETEVTGNLEVKLRFHDGSEA